MAALPPIPANVNPYPIYFDSLQTKVYRTGVVDASARWRLILLLVLTLTYALLAFVYTLLVLRRQSKRHNGVGFWIWQIKTRGDDKFFVTNMHLLGSVAAIIQAPIAFLFVYDTMRVYFDGRTQKDIFAWRAVQQIVLFTYGMLVCCGALQAYLLATAESTSRRVRASTVNWLLLAMWALNIAHQIGFGIWATLAGVDFWRSYLTLKEDLLDASARWGGTPEAQDLLSLQRDLTSLENDSQQYRVASTCQLIASILLPLCCVAVAVGGVALARKLRHQIKLQIEGLETFTLDIEPGNSSEKESLPASKFALPASQDSCSIEVLHQSTNTLPHRPLPGRVLSQQALRTLAGRQGSDDVEVALLADKAARIIDLQRANADLLTKCGSLTLCCVGILIMTIYTAQAVATNRITSGSWAVTEAGFLSVQWVVAVTQAPAFAVLIWNDLSLRPLQPWRRRDGRFKWTPPKELLDMH